MYAVLSASSTPISARRTGSDVRIATSKPGLLINWTKRTLSNPKAPLSSGNGASAAVVATPELKNALKEAVEFHGVHHVGLLCANLERSLEFYQGILDLKINPDRPHDRLPYRGAWLWIGPEMIHLMELPNPDPTQGRPAHGGRDRHFCVGVESIAPLEAKLNAAGIEYSKSMSGRPAIFFRDPDSNVLEVAELLPWK